ncbi:hypothetical protein G9A89_021425 [Geosiphon pyriformis]|nr:hypothetical protein G9A89_021425 [Geosiphon pyriformis]
MFVSSNLVRKLYCSSKLLESKYTEKSHIKQAISKKMESFELDKGHTIWSVLDFDEMSAIVKDLSNEKMAGLSDISNELWKHCDKSVLDMLLVLLNFCLKSVLTNTCPIALIETAHKILFKVFSDRIFSACSAFNVFCGDNFSVLKGTITQSSIFAIGFVVEDVLKKDRELWLALQDMHKAYDSMYGRFIKFFGSIHNGCINRVMTDFGLTDGYCVYDGLDQGEVFSPLLWCIFYDSLLYKVKRQESVYGYRLNSYFISKTGQTDFQAGLTFFFAAGAFVDDTIWVGSSQAAIQHIFDVASKFFRFNDIFINNDKMVVTDPYLIISGSSISIVKRDESYCYLGIFLSTESLSRPSLAKAHLDVWFFANLVLKKAVSNKQFAYLVSAVLFSILCYRMQFSYVPLNVCNKWDVLILKGLKSKSGLLLNFPTSVVFFANPVGILNWLFSHRSYDFQVFSWQPYHLLQFPVHVRVCPSDNFLTEMVCIFSGCDLSLDDSLAGAFCFCGGTPMSLVLGEHCFFKCVSSLHCYGIAFVEQLCNQNGDKQLDPCSPVSVWFEFSVCFLDGVVSPLSHKFEVIGDNLLRVNTAHLSVFMDKSLSGLGTLSMKAGAAAYFEDVDLEHCYIVNVIHHKNLNVNWVKVKDHLGVSDNEHADAFAKSATSSGWYLPHMVSDHVFSCLFNAADHAHLMDAHVFAWVVSSGLFCSFLCVSQLLSTCASDVAVGVALYKDFVFNNWFNESVFTFKDSKIVSLNIMNFVRGLCVIFQEDIWLVYAKHWAFMKKNGLIPCDDSICASVSGLLSVLLAGIIKLLGVANAHDVGFRFHKSCRFFSGIGDIVSVYIGV